MAPGAASMQWLDGLLRDGKGGGGNDELAAAAAVPLALTGLVLGGESESSCVSCLVGLGNEGKASPESHHMTPHTH